jgi:hypothetical protein
MIIIIMSGLLLEDIGEPEENLPTTGNSIILVILLDLVW